MLVTPLPMVMHVILVRYDDQGTIVADAQSVIVPVPEMVSTPSVKSHVRLLPHVPLSANMVPTLAASVIMA